MPEKETLARARKDKREGKSPSTQAGEFVREEIEHVREGKHGVRSTKQAIAIGLSKARRAGVELPPPPRKKSSSSSSRSPSGKKAVSHEALSRHAHASARERGKANLKRAAKKAARTRARKSK